MVADVRQIWDNAAKYNGPEHDITKMAYSLSDFFEQRYKALRESASLFHSLLHSSGSPSPLIAHRGHCGARCLCGVCTFGSGVHQEEGGDARQAEASGSTVRVP